MKHAQHPPGVSHKIERSGFTLIELLIVISIMAILAAILFPVFGTAKKSANRASCTSNLKQLAVSLNMYAQDHNGNYPSGMTVLATNSLLDAKNLERIHNKFCKTIYLQPAESAWSDVISRYIKNNNIVWCPSRYEWPYGNPRSNYEFKLWAAINTRQDIYDSPSNVAVLWEQWSYHNSTQADESSVKAELNIAFADGHTAFKYLSSATTAHYNDGPDLDGRTQNRQVMEPVPYSRSDF